ncbi:S1C family serine protease [Lacisediminimonas sp.]|uniref:S1C family serine protease n=1 Tax=Lacisediminimonas sp. TaxID=3060582 RepID=UPI00271C6793|nr:trypsin-like peptidase domain-containing protein [Lacisediminimonas sp.]MDO8298196.1 trypsin-like peptidase domain-containing protein [Lacisediminimonas sp.]MDO9219282.1 trypsin-like peptidase domain-containing protein [Lacisediminimonas sp.]
MKKIGLYSSSPTSPGAPQHGDDGMDAARSANPAERNADATATNANAAHESRPGVAIARHIWWRSLLLLVILGALAAGWQQWGPIPARPLTQRDIDRAVLHTLEKTVLPAPEVRAFDAVRRSVVRVRQFGAGAKGDQQHSAKQASEPGGDKDELLTGIGTGLVIVDTGIILTNLHVVAGANRVQVVFHDGSKSDATVIARQQENDLAVLQARSLPDDLVAATLRSTTDLALGERVIAVGFPFGIGPSVSSGVISGLRRQYASPEGDKLLSNLIQFDAAANPGNSGGPLVTMDGAVVGIVTAILNPAGQGVFIGIAFAVPIENAAAAAGESPF